MYRYTGIQLTKGTITFNCLININIVFNFLSVIDIFITICLNP